MKLVLIDCETTGPDALKDWVITVFAGVMNDDGEWGEKLNFMFNPGVPIPEEATKVHGLTDDLVAAEGISIADAPEAWAKIRTLIVDKCRDLGAAATAFNGSFDFTIVNRELTRHGLNPISWEDMFLLDPLVIDRALDKYRSGKRTLTHVAQHYGVTVDESKAHDASYDCYLTGRIVMSERFSSYEHLKGRSRSELVSMQKTWRAEQCANLQSYKQRELNDDSIIINPSWPVLK